MSAVTPGRPFEGFDTEVLPEWLDYNGHVNDSAYAVICTRANEMFLDALGLGAAYQQATGCTLYTVEAHLRYLAEVRQGARLTAETIVVDADAKRLRIHTTLRDHEAVLVLTGEYLYLHVDQGTGRVAPFPDDRRSVVDRALAAHGSLERPAHLGLGGGAPRPRP
ncbi:MAG: thioesterase family protein [Micrococcales bacterium]|nr:thioesterase family protein [Micrococcales bacterium]